jgi:hypothetical protein
VTQPHGREGITELHGELGPPDSRLHLKYTRDPVKWMRTEQTYRDGQATGDETYTAIDDPIHDLVSQVRAWGGPVVIEVTGMDPHDLCEALHPALHDVDVRINGQTFTT